MVVNHVRCHITVNKNHVECVKTFPAFLLSEVTFKRFLNAILGTYIINDIYKAFQLKCLSGEEKKLNVKKKIVSVAVY